MQMGPPPTGVLVSALLLALPPVVVTVAKTF